MNIAKQTVLDIELDKILQLTSNYALEKAVEEKILNLQPDSDPQKIQYQLHCTFEVLGSLEKNSPLGLDTYYNLWNVFPLLKIEGYALEIEKFAQIKHNSTSAHGLITFIQEQAEYFPTLFKTSQNVIKDKEIVKNINLVLDRNFEVKDSASVSLGKIRVQIKSLTKEISLRFDQRLKFYQSQNYLESTGESVDGNFRVLAVKAMYRRKVKGKQLGSSKSGNIVFILPEETHSLCMELEIAKELEKKEIHKILVELTRSLSEKTQALSSEMAFLQEIDFLLCKAKFSLSIGGVLPVINLKERKLSLIKAYHPLLKLSNDQKKQITHPQNLTLDPSNRIVVISGPNAGGKSITLKTVGLLCAMLQTGFLPSVDPKSEFCLFDGIFSDIGDGQSIENQLSTYSSRLEKTRRFLLEVTPNSLLLVDEFGTGSDPALGGALAEVFLEEFYDKHCFGVITTHYSNLKIKVETLEHAINACMLFDAVNLNPLYQLEVGQAGSSFTFEVAEKNKIPFRLINRAKKKIEEDTRKFDQTISKLQMEKSNLHSTHQSIERIKEHSEKSQSEISALKNKIENKLLDYQTLFNEENKAYQLGLKIQNLQEDYFKSKNRKKLLADFLKLVEMNLSKNLESKENALFLKQKKKELNKDLSLQKTVLEKKLQTQEKLEQKKEEKKIASLTLGARVKIKGSTSIGIIDKITKNKIWLNYGSFTTQIDPKLVEIV